MKMLHMQYASLTWCATGTEGEGEAHIRSQLWTNGWWSGLFRQELKIGQKCVKKMRRQKQKQKLNQPQLHGHVVCE